jgi:hypothetical protein
VSFLRSHFALRLTCRFAAHWDKVAGGKLDKPVYSGRELCSAPCAGLRLTNGNGELLHGPYAATRDW